MGIHPIDRDCSMVRSHLLYSDKGRPGIETQFFARKIERLAKAANSGTRRSTAEAGQGHAGRAMTG
jgi:hypothetical protein